MCNCNPLYNILGSFATTPPPGTCFPTPPVYIGPNLPCTGINNYDTFAIVVQKIEQQICSLLPTTTTTTTHSITTTTTTT